MTSKLRALTPFLLGLPLGLGLMYGCSDDDDSPDMTAGAGRAGSASSAAGSAGAAGAAGAASDPGSPGTAGAAGSAGAAGAAGAAGSASDNANLDADAGLAATDDFTFFVSSRGVGANGGDFGGLEGADALCDELATAVGQGDRTWRAFLSTNDIDAIDRIGEGPWQGADGVVIAETIADLFTDGLPQPARALRDENGIAIPTAIHDVVTGSDQDGTGLADLNCNAWTSSLATDQTVVGHADGMGPQGVDPNFGWIRAHDMNTNCDQTGLAAGGGDGRIYCFAAD